MVPDMDHLCGRPKHKSGGYKTILDRWHDDDKYSKIVEQLQAQFYEHLKIHF